MLVVISLMALLTTSCKITEPDIYLCAIVNDNKATCFPSKKSKPEFDMSVTAMTGFICASPDDFGAIKKHHSELHKAIDKKAKNGF